MTSNSLPPLGLGDLSAPVVAVHPDLCPSHKTTLFLYEKRSDLFNDMVIRAKAIITTTTTAAAAAASSALLFQIKEPRLPFSSRRELRSWRETASGKAHPIVVAQVRHPIGKPLTKIISFRRDGYDGGFEIAGDDTTGQVAKFTFLELLTGVHVRARIARSFNLVEAPATLWLDLPPQDQPQHHQQQQQRRAVAWVFSSPEVDMKRDRAWRIEIAAHMDLALVVLAVVALVETEASHHVRQRMVSTDAMQTRHGSLVHISQNHSEP